MKSVYLVLILMIMGTSRGYEHSRQRWKRHLASEAGRMPHNTTHNFNIELLKEPRKPNSFHLQFDLPILNTPPPRAHSFPNLSTRTIVETPRNYKNQARTSAKLQRPRSPKATAFSINADILKAEGHRFAMQLRTRCALPREQVICVKDLYPDTDVKYYPACTLLHRCSQKRSHSYDETPSSITKAEDEDDYSPEEDDAEENILGNCPRCPKPFNKRLVRGVCDCDCFDNDEVCLAIKRGNEALTNAERRCISSRVCQKPRCDKGTHFNVDLGECRKFIEENNIDDHLYDNDESDANDDDDDSEEQNQQQLDEGDPHPGKAKCDHRKDN
ncbi:uncharacterized protein LOC111270049 isoform X2 [Varroa jacobsoni]|uniref:uncharacterized protein LOC111270049 isoform X2 n=1 Tax=Varroa jacobsoni TaxID=62625 RepID=UPI000BF508A9|nr:uncharacterized protein LOC111270049 isoform X2 [Varroa jacobsoni]